MKRLSKAERERRESQRQDSEAIKGVNAKAVADLTTAAAGYVAIPASQFTWNSSVWGSTYQNLVNGGTYTWGSSSNQLASPSSPNPNLSSSTLTWSGNGFFAPYISPSQCENPYPPKRKLPARRIATPVIGYRSWHVEFPDEKHAVLWATGVGLKWPGAAMRARCSSQSPRYMAQLGLQKHRAPHERCTCGVHAYKQVHAIGQGGGELWGAVVTWGKHVEHGDEGYRAANARVIAFTYPPRQKGDPKIDYKTWVIRKLLAEIAGERLGVPVVPYEKLELYAKEFGSPLD